VVLFFVVTDIDGRIFRNYIVGMDDEVFEWDEAKSRRCLQDRGFDFSIVHEFDFETAVIAKDTRKNYGEDRFRAFGFAGSDLFCVVFTPRGDRLRIISMRRMHRKEGARYGLIKET